MYVEALQHPEICFRDPDLQKSTPDLDNLHRPRPISGNFASVFSVTSSLDARRYAIKCFTRPAEDQDLRYRAISEHLSSITQTWKVGFEYQPEGIRVEGALYPALKMDWVTGTGLSSWIDKNIRSRQAILEISTKFADVISCLEEDGIAHGDLQHGNLLVTADKTLRLVDYDGMFVPALTGMSAAERGHRNYQSPSRGNEFDEKIDRFSAWTIYMSLVALAEQPDLWTQLREQGGEYLLLSEEDFKDPSASARFPALLNSPTSDVRGLAQRVLELASMPISTLPRLQPVSPVLTATRLDVTYARSEKEHAQAAHPNWMASHLAPHSSLDPVEFVGRSFAMTIFARILPFLATILSILAVIGGYAASAAATFLMCVVSTCGIALQVLFRRRPEVARKQPARDELHELAALIKDAQKEADKTEADTAKFEASDLRRQNAEKAERDRYHTVQRNASAEADRIMRSQLQKLASEKSQLIRSRQSELDQYLTKIRNEHIDYTLERIPLSNVKLEGFGPKLWANLRDVGVATAADFTGVRFHTSGQSKVAFIVLKSGREVRVPGVAQVKATRLETWRISQVARAEQSAPAQLPSLARDRINTRYSNLERDIAAAEQKAQTNAQVKKVDLGRVLALELSRLADRQRENNAAAALARVSCAQRKASANAKLSTLRPRYEAAKFECAAYSGITFITFLRYSVVGRSG